MKRLWRHNMNASIQDDGCHKLILVFPFQARWQNFSPKYEWQELKWVFVYSVFSHLGKYVDVNGDVVHKSTQKQYLKRRTESTLHCANIFTRQHTRGFLTEVPSLRASRKSFDRTSVNRCQLAQSVSTRTGAGEKTDFVIGLFRGSADLFPQCTATLVISPEGSRRQIHNAH